MICSPEEENSSNQHHQYFQPKKKMEFNDDTDLVNLRVFDWKARAQAATLPSKSKKDNLPKELRQDPRVDTRKFAAAIALGAIQVIKGLRPINQLDRWLSYEIYDALWERTKLYAHCHPWERKFAKPMRVQNVHIQRIDINPQVVAPAEAAVSVFDGERVRAVALRLQAHRGNWKVTALEIA